ncbi:FHIPEP family type III secretion protein [Cellulomonas sp. URHB0016]
MNEPFEIVRDGAPVAFPRQWALDALAYAGGEPPRHRAIHTDVATAVAASEPSVLAEAVALVEAAVVGEAAIGTADAAPDERLTVHVEPGYLRYLTTRLDADDLGRVRGWMFDELGIVLPPLRLAADPALRPRGYRFSFGPLTTVPRLGLLDGSVAVLTTAYPAADEEASADPPENARLVTAGGRAGWELPEERTPEIEAKGYFPCGPVYLVIVDLIDTIRSWAPWLHRPSATSTLLELLARQSPALTTPTEALGADEVHQLVVGLLGDGVTVRNLRRIVELALRYDDVPSAAPDRLTFVRWGLAEEIGASVARRTDTAVVYLLSSDLEAEAGDRLRAAAEAELRQLGAASVPAILTEDHRRCAVRDAVRSIVPSIQVVGFSDLPDHLNVQPVARLGG